MRWIGQIYHDNDIRIHTFFAWFPVYIKQSDTLAVRWLTKVTVRQRFYCGRRCCWQNIAFIGE